MNLITFFLTDKDKAAVSQFAKNYLPIFFNLFTMDPDNPHDGRRLATLETIKVYMSIADTQVSFYVEEPSLIYL